MTESRWRDDFALARAEVLRLWRETLDEQDSLSAAEQADRYYASLSKNPVIVAALAKKALRDLIHELGIDYMHKDRAVLRRQIKAQSDIAEDAPVDVAASVPLSPSVAKTAVSRWSSWFEFVNGRHINLLKMTRADLVVAAESRRQQAKPHLEAAQLFEKLAAKMPSETATVEECYSEQKINQMAAKIWAADAKDEAA